MDTTPCNAHALPSELQKFRLLTEQQVSLLTGKALQTLRNDRFTRKGFPYVKLGQRCVRYKISDVLAFIESGRIDPQEAI